jgi:Peptidase family M28
MHGLAGHRPQIAALTGLAALALLGAAVLVSLSPPPALPASAPAQRFSAERAMRHVEALAREPRPVGSASHDRARDYLVEQLAVLGLELQVQSSTAVWTRHGQTVAARVDNVLGRVRGTDSTGAVLLMAHYDSRSLTPGAGDDASGVAALLEAARAVTVGAPPRNDLIYLFTDGEELALLGAAAFADEHPWAAEVQAVFNFEARGNAGRAVMFETGAGNLREALQLRAVRHPIASSLSGEVYRRMPNDTDFTIFRRRGLPGMNFAFIGGHPAYHSMLDTPQRLSRGSLQQLGEYAVAVARRYGEIDLVQRSAGDAVYFNPAGSWLVVYPSSWAAGLAGVAALLTLAACLLARRRRLISWSGLTAASGLLLGLLAAAGLLGWVFWWLLEAFASGRLRTPHGLPYFSGVLTLALGIAVLAVATVGSTAWRWVVSDFDLVAAAALLWSALALATSVVAAGASYVSVWPALGTAVGLLAASSLRAGAERTTAAVASSSFVDCLVWVGAASVSLVLWVPMAQQVSEALSLRLAPVVAVVEMLALLALLPLLRCAQGGVESAPRGAGRPGLSAALVALALVLAVVALLVAEPGRERPSVDSLTYLRGPEEGSASWLSFDVSPDAWSSNALGAAPEPAKGAYGPVRGVRWRATAPVLDLAAPELEILSEERNESGERRLEVRLRSPRGAPVVRLDAEASVPMHLVAVDGRAVDTVRDGGEVHLVAFGAPPEGLLVTLRVDGRWPVEATLSDQSYGLPSELPLPARPEHLISDLRWQAEATWVARELTF